MADVSLIDPYSAQQESIARRRRMAQALQQQAQTPLETPQTPGVLLSPYAGLAKVLQGLVGGYQEAQADKEYKTLGEEARKNQSEDLAKVLGAIRAPARPEIEAQEAVMDMPERIIPGQTISQYGGTLNIPGQTIPKVAYQPAIAPQPARPAGYISPELIADIKDPTARNLALAQLIKQTEPDTFIKGSPGDVFYDKFGNKKFSVPAAAGSTTLSPLGKLQSERAAIFASDPKDARLAQLDAAIAKETKDVAADRLAWDQKVQEAKDKAPNYTYKEEVDPTTGVKSLIKIDNKGVVSEVLNSAGTKVKTEIPKTPAHYSEIEDKGNIVIVDMNLPADQRLAKGQIKGPIRGNLKQIETNDAEGRPVTRWVDESTLAALGDIPKQYTGLLLEMAQAGQLKKGWESDPRVAGVIRDNLINQSGGITPARLADIRVRIAEAAARLGDLGIAFDAKGLTPSLSNLTTLPSGSSAAAAPAAAVAKAPPKINDVVINGDKKFRFKGGDPNQQSNWVEVK